MNQLLVESLQQIKGGSQSAKSSKISIIAGDASLRKYYRVQQGRDTFVLMVAEPFEAAKSTFLQVRGFLEAAKVPVPKLYAAAPDQGALLLEDLGGDTMLHSLKGVPNPKAERKYFERAIDLMLKIHERAVEDLPSAVGVEGLDLAFDEEKLMWEVDFTMEHLFKNYLKRELSPKDYALIRDAFRDICKRLAKEPRVFTHRDYHTRNVMIPKSGIFTAIDFQDARMGLRQYDLASLLRDSYYQLSDEMVYELVDYYWKKAKNRSDLKKGKTHFVKLFDLMSVQRGFKAIGSFTMFYAKRGDAGYLRFVGNTFENIRKNLAKFPEYKDLKKTLFQYYYF